MIRIYDYLDYQQFLRDYLDARKKNHAWFSIRYFAKKIGMDQGNLVKLLQGKRHASKKVIPRITATVKFNANEEIYFRTLVAFNRASKQTDSRELFEQLLALKSVTLKKVKPQQYDYYRKWYHTAIYTMLHYYDFRGDFQKLAADLNPPISVKDAKGSVALLEKLGMIEKNRWGRYELVQRMVTTGEVWHSVAIQSYQEDTLKLALRSLRQNPKKSRDISTLTMTLGKSDLDVIREITEDYRKSVLKVVHESESQDEVYQLNIQLFPLTRVKGGGG